MTDALHAEAAHPENDGQTNVPVIQIDEDWLWHKIITQDRRDIAFPEPESHNIQENAGLVLMHPDEEGETQFAGVFVTKVYYEQVPLLGTYLWQQIMETNPETKLTDMAMVVVFEPFPALDQILHNAADENSDAEIA